MQHLLTADRSTWTVLAVYLASVIERASEQCLPSVYAPVSLSFRSSPARLGLITLGRTLAQSLASPFSGVAGRYVQTLASIGLFKGLVRHGWAFLNDHVHCITLQL
jgi:hypothetical protein